MIRFRDDRQRRRCCLLLLRGLGEKRARYWDEHGPMLSARASVVGRPDAGLSRGEAVLIRLALDVWNGSGHVLLSEAIEVLDDRNVQLVGSLVLSASDGIRGVDAWIEVNTIKESVEKAVKKVGGANVHPIRRRRA